MFEESMSAIPSIWASMNSWFTPAVLFVLLNLMIGTIAITSSLATHKPSHDQNQQALQAQPPHGHHHHQLARSPSVLQRLKSVNFYSRRSHEPSSLFDEKHPDFDSHFSLQESAPQQEFHQPTPVPLSRSPSILQKLKSINLSSYFHQEPITTTLQKSQETESYFPPEKICPQTSEEKQFLEQEEQHHRAELEEEEEEEEEEEKEQFEDHQEEQTLDEIYRKLQSKNKVSRSKSDTKPSSGEIPTKLPRKLRKSASVKSAFAHFEDIDAVESRRPATVREGKSSRVTEEDDAEVDAKADDFINKFKQQLKLQRVDSILRYKEMINRGSGS